MPSSEAVSGARWNEAEPGPEGAEFLQFVTVATYAALLQAGADLATIDVKVRDVIRAVERAGWRLNRMRGSHRQYVHPLRPGTVTIAGHPSAEVKPKTLASILRQAGINKEER